MHGRPQRKSKEHRRWRYAGPATIQEVRLVMSRLVWGILSPSDAPAIVALLSCFPRNSLENILITNIFEQIQNMYWICMLHKCTNIYASKSIWAATLFVWLSLHEILLFLKTVRIIPLHWQHQNYWWLVIDISLRFNSSLDTKVSILWWSCSS